VTLYFPGGPIILAAHDAAWADAFLREADAINGALSDLSTAVHHIGSTAINGLVAKPVLDILLVVPQLDMLDLRTEPLVALGYEARGEFGIPGRRYFSKTSPQGIRTHQIHAYAREAEAVQRHLDFRDYLRAHPSVANEYGRLKMRLAKSFGTDVEGYATAKTTFVREVERLAAAWRAESSDFDSAV
jgi:GrpB-like predicted nucleotidyltransferase (UPF0157 family)